MDTVAIHGAWSGPVSFNYLRGAVKSRWHTLTYDPLSEDMDTIVDRLASDIRAPSLLVGHSLGGVIALRLHDHPMVKGIVTVASPLAGLRLNLIQKIMSLSGILAEIATDSRCIRSMHAETYTKPVQHLIATVGFNPFIYEPNDGVLPLKSQTGWTCGPTVDIATNHYEIMLHEHTAAALSKTLAALLINPSA
jgi:pimeloyl-ACP methyl ester carboxylesterase